MRKMNNINHKIKHIYRKTIASIIIGAFLFNSILGNLAWAGQDRLFSSGTGNNNYSSGPGVMLRPLATSKRIGVAKKILSLFGKKADTNDFRNQEINDLFVKLKHTIDPKDSKYGDDKIIETRRNIGRALNRALSSNKDFNPNKKQINILLSALKRDAYEGNIDNLDILGEVLYQILADSPTAKLKKGQIKILVDIAKQVSNDSVDLVLGKVISDNFDLFFDDILHKDYFSNLKISIEAIRVHSIKSKSLGLVFDRLMNKIRYTKREYKKANLAQSLDWFFAGSKETALTSQQVSSMLDLIEDIKLKEDTRLKISSARSSIPYLVGIFHEALVRNPGFFQTLATSLKTRNNSVLNDLIVEGAISEWVRGDPDEYLPMVIKAFNPNLGLFGNVLMEHGSNLNYYTEGLLSTLLFRSDSLPPATINFVETEKNETMLSEKLKFFCHVVDVKLSDGIVNYITEFHNDSVHHSKKLFFLRRVNNMLNYRIMQREDTLASWRILFEDYFQDFNLLVNKHLVLCHRYLSQNRPLKGKELSRYSLDKIGITTTGREGITQLKKVIDSIKPHIFETRDIDEKFLSSPITEALIGGWVGFNTGEWSHGGSFRDFVVNFHSKKETVSAFDTKIEDKEAIFIMRRLGKIEFTRDEKRIFKRYSRLVRKADYFLDIQTPKDRIERLRTEADSIISEILDDLKAKDVKAEGPRAEEALKRDIFSLENAIQGIKECDSPIELVLMLITNIERVVYQNSELQDIIILSLLIELFSQYPNVKNDIISTLQHEPSLLSIGKIIGLKMDFLKEHILTDIDNKTAKKILKVFRTKIFEDAYTRMETLQDETISVEAFITKGILGELAGDIADVCYATYSSDIMEHPSMVGALIFTKGEGPVKEFIGSMLILKNSIGGEKTWLLRAINPQEDFISKHNAEDFLIGAIGYVEKLAELEDVKHIVASTVGLSNMAPIRLAIDKFTFGESITLDTPENFNNVEITTCKALSSQRKDSEQEGVAEDGKDAITLEDRKKTDNIGQTYETERRILSSA